MVLLTPDTPARRRQPHRSRSSRRSKARCPGSACRGSPPYFGLLDVGRPRPGDTVVVSAASGAVGQLVGQIAKLSGCRAVAIAGSEEKLAWCREIGFDAGINYRTAADLPAAVKEACPRGVDVFFDNTGGPIHDAVMKNLALHARVVICGRVALAGQFDKPDIGERFMGNMIVTTITGFLVHDWWHRRARGCAGSRAGSAREKSASRRTCWTASSACRRRSCGCLTSKFWQQIVRIGRHGLVNARLAPA